MRNLLKSLSLLGLVVLLTLPGLQFLKCVSADVGMWGIQIGTVLWFTTAPFWIGRRKPTPQGE
jgi:hypothetical protein